MTDTAPDYVDLVLPALLAQARLTHTRAIRAAFAREGYEDMPRAGARVIGRLARGATSVTEVGGAYDVSKQAASKLVDALVVRGYVERVPDQGDRRRLNVVLTERGRGAAAALRDAIDEVDGRFLDVVGPAEAYRMRQALAVLAALGDGSTDPRLGEEPPAVEHGEPRSMNGKLCYLELPTDDADASATFYRTVFGWKIRTRGDGSLTFSDSAGQVGGTWVPGAPPQAEPTMIMYVMVDDVEQTLKTIAANGGRTVEGIGRHAPEITARFADPYGNVLGLYQEPA